MLPDKTTCALSVHVRTKPVLGKKDYVHRSIASLGSNTLEMVWPRYVLKRVYNLPCLRSSCPWADRALQFLLIGFYLRARPSSPPKLDATFGRRVCASSYFQGPLDIN